MRKLNLFITILLLLVLTACGQSVSGDQSEGSEEKVIKVGATPDGYPQYYKENDELKGFNVDVFEAIFQKIDYKVEWVLQDWTGVLASMETGKVDTIANFAVTPEREEKYNYSDPFYYASTVVAVSQKNDAIQSLEDLKGKRVASVLGTNYENVLKENDPNNEIEIVPYEVTDVVFQDVATGKIDAFVSGREILLAQINDKNIPLKVAGETFGEKLVAIPFAKNEENNQLITEVNQAIEELRADGTLKEISEKWFGIDATISSAE